MPALVQNGIPIFTDIDGDPLEDGYIYIGEAGLNPLSNPLQAYWDANLTVPAGNLPTARTKGGAASYNGAPSRLYVATNYSILVQDKKQRTVYSVLNSVDYYNSPSGDLLAQTDTIATLREIVPVDNGQSMRVGGYYAKGDILNIPVYIWDVGSLLNDNGGSVIKPTAIDSADPGRWIWSQTAVDAVNVKWFGAKGDGVTVDTTAIQEAIDFEDNRYAVYMPQGDYVIDKPINLKKKGLFSDAQIRQCVIRTNGAFDTTDGYQMLRNWDTSWYAGGETGVARKLPPADLTGRDIGRYVTLSNIFIVCADAELTNCYFVAQQETSGLKNININVGISPNNADYGIVLDSSSTGTAIAQNGVILRDIVFYGENCKSLIKVFGSGNDVHFDTINIGSIQCTENPIDIDTIDGTITNLHCEAVAPDGDYIINLPGGSDGLSITQSIFFLANLGSGGGSGMAGIVNYNPTNPTGFGRSTPRLTDITITPTNPAETSNLGDMLILNDQALGVQYKLKYASYGSGVLITKVHELSPNRLIADNSNEVIDIAAYGSNLNFRTGDNTSLVTGSNVPLPVLFQDNNVRYFMVFQVLGRNDVNGRPFVIEGTCASGRNASAVFQTEQQIDKELNVPAGLSIVFNAVSEQFELSTTSASSIPCTNFNFTGFIDFNEID